MEQPNMNMMPTANGMPAGMNTMQRPQPGNVRQQLHAKILTDLRANQSQSTGWQATFDIMQRANQVMQLVTGLRFLEPNVPKCLHIAQNFEARCVSDAPNRETYFARMAQKLREIQTRRQQQVDQNFLQGNGAMMQPNMMGVPNGMNNGMNGMGNVNPMHMVNTMNGINGMGNMNGMNPMPNNGMNMHNMGNMSNGMNMGMNGMSNANMASLGMQPGGGMGLQQQGQVNNGLGPNNGIFPTQLQRQMQPSPIPPTQPTSMDPSLLQQGPQPSQPPQQQAQLGNHGQLQPHHVSPNGQAPQGANSNISAETIAMAKHAYNKLNDVQKNAMRIKALNSLPDAQRAALSSGTGDPLLKIMVSQQHRQNQRNRSNAQINNGNNMGMHPGNGGAPPPPPQPGSQNFDFSSLIGQQVNAMKSQESGEQVVPASNNPNAMGIGNQLATPQSINPQMLGNMGNNPGNPAESTGIVSSQMLQQQQQQQAQARDRLQKQMMAQQAQANNNHQAMLRGQPGGLNAPNAFNNTPVGAMHSPAMPMLNRPLAPPGPNTPTTPQPSHQQPTPASSMSQQTSQMAQHYQSMLNQNTLSQQGQQQQVSLQAKAFQQMPEHLRNKMLSMPPAQRATFFEMLQKSQAEGQQAMLNNMLPNMNTGPSPQGNVMAPGMMQPGINNAVPGFNVQPPANQQHQPAAANTALRQHNQQLQFRAMDMRPFPRGILQSLQMNAPPQVQTWKQLREHAMQNLPALQPNTLENIGALQSRYFSQNAAERQAVMHAVQELRNNQQNQHMPPNNAPQVVNPMTDRPAPAAQMVAPAAPMQAQAPKLGPGAKMGQIPAHLMPTAQEIATFRQRVPPGSNVTDEQLRHMILQTKVQRRRAMSAAQAQQNAVMQPNQPQRPPNPSVNGPQNSLPTANAPVQRTPRPPPVNQANNAAGLQNPSHVPNDDVIEISSLPVHAQGPPAPPMQPNRSQHHQPQRPPGAMSQEDIAKLPPRERQTQLQKAKLQGESLRKAQNMASGQRTPAGQTAPPPATAPATRTPSAAEQKLRAMHADLMRANPKGPAVQLDPASLEKVKMILKKLWTPLTKIDQTFPIAMQFSSSNEQSLKDVIRARILFQQNALDDQGNIRDYCSLTVDQLLQLEHQVGSYLTKVNEFVAAKNAAQASEAQAAGAQASGRPQVALGKPGQVTPGAPNEVQAAHIRKSSSASKAPPAPTDNKTFDWARSPHGVPKYDTRNELTPDKLKIPAQKKRKTEAQGSTPGAAAGTPASVDASPALPSGRMPGPDAAKQPQPGVKVETERPPELKRFRCPDAYCEASLHGFDTEAELKQHEELEHAPVTNHMEYFLRESAAALNVDLDGKTLAVSKPTPARPQARSNASTIGKRGLDDKATVSTSKAPTKAPDLRDDMMHKTGFGEESLAKWEAAADEDEVVDELAWLRACPPVSDEKLAYARHVHREFWAFSEQLRKDEQEERDKQLNPTADKDGDLWVGGLTPPKLTPDTATVSPRSDISPRDQLKLVVKMNDWDPFEDGNPGIPDGLMGLVQAEHNVDVAMGGTAAGTTNLGKRKSPGLDDADLPDFDYADYINEAMIEWPQSPKFTDAFA